MESIITLTMNPTLDKSAYLDHVIAERKLRCHTVHYAPGGGGVNVSRAIQKLGGESLAVYTVGGPTGQVFQNLVSQEGFRHQPISIEDWTREGLTVSEESTGQQFRFNLPGPTLRPEEWQQGLDILFNMKAKPDWVVASGSLPDGVPRYFYARIARWVKDMGSRFILDTSTQEALRLALNEGVYLIKPNLHEFKQLMNRQLEEEAEQEAAAMEIVQKGQSKAVVLSLGAAGVMLVFDDQCERLRAPTVPVKSKVGAGDSTVAGIVLALARGKSLRHSVQFGIAAGAAAVMTPGTELCRREDTERLYQKMVSD